ncbi:MAG: transposase [Candidatus Latescibacteria bacterium]|nr:transposase [Candidatus Latescibacterota bacterium]
MTKFNYRCSARLKGYDYTKTGAYFVTICTYRKEHYLGKIMNGRMVHSTVGNMCIQNWSEIPQHFTNVELDQFVIMPNHMHGIVFITNRNTSKENDITQKKVSELRDLSNTNIDDITQDVGTGYILSLRDQHSPNQYNETKQNRFQHVIPRSLSIIIASFKAAVTRNAKKNQIPMYWQSRFHDHIIRSEHEFDRIRHYIKQNPHKWELDRENSLSDNYKITYYQYFRGLYDN